MRAFPALWVFLVFSLPVQAQEIRAFIPIKLGTEQAGPYIRLMARIGDLTGITFILEDSLPPTRAKRELQAGLLDCSIGQADFTLADVRGDVAWAEEPLVVGNHVVITTQPFSYSSQADFSGKAVLALKESAPVEILKADVNIKYVEAPTASAALKMLLAKRADILVMHDALFANTLESTPEVTEEHFFVASVPYLRVKNLIWFSKKHENLARKVDRALRQLKTSGEYALIMSGKGS